MPTSSMHKVNRIAYSNRYMPLWGWHDDHRKHDGTAAYLPALQQVHSEFSEFVKVLETTDRRSCLQLGMGACTASHDVWCALFGHAITLSLGCSAVAGTSRPSMDTRSLEAIELAGMHSLYDLLFIDAGHTYAEVEHDHRAYGPMVRPGGIIAFHDSVRRPQFDGLEVWRYLQTLHGLEYIDGEVGIAWLRA